MLKRTQRLVKPNGDYEIPVFVRSFTKAKAKNNASSLLLKEMKKHNVTKSQIAKRLNKDPAVITRMLGGPANITMDTLAELLWAISGKFVAVSADDPWEAALTNHETIDYFRAGSTGSKVGPRLEPSSTLRGQASTIDTRVELQKHRIVSAV